MNTAPKDAEAVPLPTYAADGKTIVYNIRGYPLMVRAVDFNAAYEDACRADVRARLAAQQPVPSDAEIASLRVRYGITANARGIKEFDQVASYTREAVARWGTPPTHAQADAAPAPAMVGLSGWQPIETAPKDGSLVVLGASNGVWLGKYLPVYGSGYRPENPWSSMLLNHDHMAERYTRPTHWMPLPPAPGTVTPAAAVPGQQSNTNPRLLRDGAVLPDGTLILDARKPVVQPDSVETRDELALIEAVLKGYPPSMARNDALRACRALSTASPASNVSGGA